MEKDKDVSKGRDSIEAVRWEVTELLERNHKLEDVLHLARYYAVRNRYTAASMLFEASACETKSMSQSLRGLAITMTEERSKAYDAHVMSNEEKETKPEDRPEGCC